MIIGRPMSCVASTVAMPFPIPRDEPVTTIMRGLDILPLSAELGFNGAQPVMIYIASKGCVADYKGR
jgi:hypothetical protein